MFLLLKDKPKKFCSLIFLRMVSNYYANYIELFITNNFRTDTYVGRRTVCPSESVLQLLADLFPICLSFQCSAAQVTVILYFIQDAVCHRTKFLHSFPIEAFIKIFFVASFQPGKDSQPLHFFSGSKNSTGT